MKNHREIIDHLSPADALAILRTLADSDPVIAKRITELAMEQLSEVDPEELAADVYDVLDSLAVEEVWDRAGPTRYGCVEPSEAADQVVEETLNPFLEVMARYQKLGMNAEANRMCMGLLLGLYRLKHESTIEFKDWAPDAPTIFAEAVVVAWKAGSPTQADFTVIQAFIEDELCGWGANLV